MNIGKVVNQGAIVQSAYYQLVGYLTIAADLRCKIEQVQSALEKLTWEIGILDVASDAIWGSESDPVATTDLLLQKLDFVPEESARLQVIGLITVARAHQAALKEIRVDVMALLGTEDESVSEVVLVGRQTSIADARDLLKRLGVTRLI